MRNFSESGKKEVDDRRSDNKVRRLVQEFQYYNEMFQNISRREEGI